MPSSSKKYPGFDNTLLETARKEFLKEKFHFSKLTLRGCLFTRTDRSSSILLDHLVCDNTFPYEYNEYTKEQNALMHKHDKLFRFFVDDTQDLKDTCSLLKRLLAEDFSEDEINTSGRNRELAEIDPTMPEAIFEQAFIDRALLMVPSRQLKFDHIENITARLTDYGVSEQVRVGEDPD